MNRHPNCHCVCNIGPPTEAQRIFLEEGRKAIALILLSAAGRRTIIVPTQEEWIGVGLLERDDGLPARSPICECRD